MKLNSDSICGCENAGLDKPGWGRFTKSQHFFAHVFETPIDPIHLPDIPKGKVKTLRLLQDMNELKISSGFMTHAF
jgi:alpha-L-fucosidase